MKCLYCSKEIESSLKENFKINEVSACCSQNCKDLADRNLSKPFSFKLSSIFGQLVVVYMLLAFVNEVTIKFLYFSEVINICWGVFILLLSFISKPIFPTCCIKTSILITRLCGLALIVLPIIGMIQKIIK